MINEFIRITKSICESFNKNQVKYCITGGIAVSLRAEIRTTKDIDFIILLKKNEEIALFEQFIEETDRL